ncbi:MAG: hypothetical protein ACK5ZA_12420, partial [Betaproteobacteria bacterium]
LHELRLAKRLDQPTVQPWCVRRQRRRCEQEQSAVELLAGEAQLARRGRLARQRLPAGLPPVPVSARPDWWRRPVAASSPRAVATAGR